MIETKDEVQPIEVVRVTEADRMLENFGGDAKALLAFEMAIYDVAGRITRGKYGGGSWKLKYLSNHGFFMAYTGSDTFTVFNDGAQCEVECSGDLFSLIVNVYACSILSFNFNDKGYSEASLVVAGNYYRLRDYVYHDHSVYTEAEQRAFYKALD